MKKTVLYLRVSTQDQDLEPQRMALTEECTRRGWKIDGEYMDVISGSKESRTGLNALLDACEAGEVGAVLATKIDRVSRSLKDFVLLVDRLNKLSVALVCPGQGIDTGSETAHGAFFRNIFAAFAEFERELIRSRTRDGLAVARAKGKTLGRPSTVLVRDWKDVVKSWKAEGGEGYGELARRLGGVSKSTAWRLSHRDDLNAKQRHDNDIS